MQIVQIGQFPLSGKLACGGVEASVLGLACEQAKSHCVVVMDMPRKGIVDTVEHIENVTIYRYCNQGGHNKDAITRVGDIVEKITSLQPSVCHIHGTGLFSWKMFESLTGKGIPMMLTVHGLINEEKRKSLNNHFSFKILYQLWTQTSAERQLLQSASKAIVDTQYVAEQIGKYGLLSIPKLTVIPQGIDDVFFDLSCSRDSQMILSVGVFSPRKGHLFMIQAFERTSKKYPDATLTICGVVSDKAYFKDVVEYVKASPCKNKISILTNLPKDRLYALYKQAHIFALHSQEESQGIVFAEAMAVGLPVVATNVGGIPYVVENEVTGLLSSYGDIAEFACSLERLLTDDSKWGKMSVAGKVVSHQYAWSSIAQRVEAAYLAVV